ncbi:hypothetical protein C5D07_14490 [Rathayibacter tritici]|uniref:hypothetical protein n=1 Tax=Rathayibacter tritici TaxID=33888 RepID=UPI000CE87D8F|nr:hypothetical protein [Rathayibacter tritici]PPF23360.1 hypothetical protein C5C06_14170 [Rathayibacter tritici]PPI11163.1 hypothetical protein C5D07_14490 [Rathayibacter tritici]
MNDSTPRTPREIRIDDGWTIPAEDGVHRRTLVKGSAWTVPVLALSVATPAAAASGSPTLAFTQSSYSGKACGTITGVQVKRTTDGSTADPGKVVTVRLADGYTFADGSTTVSRTTGTDGLVTLPDITVPSSGGDSAFKAASDSLTTSARVSSTASDKTGIYLYDYANKKSSDVVTDSATAKTMVSDGADTQFYYQNSDGTIRDSGGKILEGTESGVSTDPALFSASRWGNKTTVAYKKSDGVYLRDYSGKSTSGPIKNSAKAVRVISDAAGSQLYFQNSDGSLYDASGTPIEGTESGVSTDAGLVSASRVNNTSTLHYKKSDGIYSYDYSKGETSGPITDSATATRLISNANSHQFYFQTSNGKIYDGSGKIIPGTENGVSTDTTLIAASHVNNRSTIHYKKSDGIYSYDYEKKATSGPIAFSSDAKSIIADADSNQFYFQTPNGTIRNGSGEALTGTDTDVDTGDGLVSASLLSNRTTIAYKKSPACS